MKLKTPKFALCAGICCLAFVGAALAGSARAPVAGVPKIQGREIERFVLVDYVRMKASQNPGMGSSSAFVILPGQFLAASQDAGGVYYQSVNGFRMVHDPDTALAGGVYVSRTGASSMTVYFGDARNLAVPLSLLNHRPMIVEDMKKFQVAKGTAAGAPER